MGVLFVLAIVTAFGKEMVQEAEWDPPTLVLVHEPNAGGELLVPGLHAPSALFETAFDPMDAAKDHQNFVNKLKARHIQVISVKEALLLGTEDEKGPNLARLRKLAHDSVTVNVSAYETEEERQKQRAYMHESISAYRPEQLFQIILQRPSLTITKTEKNTYSVAAYTVSPVMNLYFLRDQSITTAKGRILCNMNSPQRSPESAILDVVYTNLGQDVIYRVTGEGRLEGGDFIPAREYSFIGQGLRTNAEAIKQLLDHDAFGSQFVVVVKDRWYDQTEMHLDTYFNVISSSLAIMVETRLKANTESKLYTTCDVYQRSSDSYVNIYSDRNFTEYLHSIGYKIIPVSKEDQLIYGCNFLTIQANQIMLVKRGKGVSDTYKQALREHGVDIQEEVEMTSLTKGYGAAHCSTQVAREPPKSPLHRDL